MKRILLAVLVCAAASQSGCATRRVPADVLQALTVVETQTHVYVDEANWALEKAQHPDRDVLIGTGERLKRAIKAVAELATEVSK